MSKLWLLLLAVVLQSANAGLTLGVHTYSYHFAGPQAAGSRGWNNYNPGIYADYDGFTAGVYRNSLFRTSYYAGYTVNYHWLSLTIGGVSGYDKVVPDGQGDHTDIRCAATCRKVSLKSVISPMLVPSVVISLENSTAARLSLVMAPNAPLAIHLSIERRF